MAREDLHFRLRIPEQLKAKVLKAAYDNHRSMTAEIIARLERSFPPTEPIQVDPEVRELAEIAAMSKEETGYAGTGFCIMILNARPKLPEEIRRLARLMLPPAYSHYILPDPDERTD